MRALLDSMAAVFVAHADKIAAEARTICDKTWTLGYAAGFQDGERRAAIRESTVHGPRG